MVERETADTNGEGEEGEKNASMEDDESRVQIDKDDGEGDSSGSEDPGADNKGRTIARQDRSKYQRKGCQNEGGGRKETEKPE